MTIPASSEGLSRDIIIGVASNLTYGLLKYGLQKIHDYFGGSSHDKMIHAINEAGFINMLEEISKGLDGDEVNNLKIIFETFLSDSIVSKTFLEVSMTGFLPNIKDVKNRFTALGFDVNTLPFDFDEGIAAFCKGASIKAIELASEPGNNYSNPIILGRLRTALGLLLRQQESLDQIAKDIKKFEDVYGSIIYSKILGVQTVRNIYIDNLREDVTQNSLIDISYSEQANRLICKLPYEVDENRLFGIKEKVDQLLVELRNPQKHIYSIQGAGGIGKTSLAIYTIKKLILDNYQCYDLIWVNAKQEYINERGVFSISSKINLSDVLDEIGIKIKILGFKQLNFKQKVEVLANEFKSKLYIVVIDNLETIEDFEGIYQVLEKSANPSKFLITTRHGFPYPINKVEVYELPELSKNACIDLINNIVKTKEISIQNLDTDRVINVIGGNPLAINLVIPQMAQLHSDIVLSNIQTGASESMFRYIYKNSWSLLPGNEKKVLQRIMLAGERAEWSYLLRKTKLTSIELWECIQNLINLSLTHPENQSYFAIHRLLSTFLRIETITWK